MELSTIALYGFMALTAISALFISRTKNVLYAAFALILTFIGIAGIYLFLAAEFIAATQILVYVGGILILLVFGIMLTNKWGGQKVKSALYNRSIGFIACAGLFAILITGILQANFSALQWIDRTRVQPNSLKQFGFELMTDYVLAFEIIGFLLLLALIGAVRIAGKARKEGKNAL